jgi:ribosomal subunit interface protein
MQTPLQLTFRSMAHSDALAAHLQRRADKLERLFDRIVSCHVTVSLAGHHHSHGDRYHFKVNVGLPGQELVASHEPKGDRNVETAYESADHAFDEAERQLEDWVRRHRDLRREPATLAAAKRS